MNNNYQSTDGNPVTDQLTRQVMTPFQRTWSEFKTKNYEPELYSRRKVYKHLGFEKVKDLTDWLRENNFIDFNDYPCYYLLEKKLMEVKYRYVTHRVEKYNYDDSSRTKSFACPLFTDAGIKFLTNLLKDPEELKKVVTEIQGQLVCNSKKLL